MGFGRRLPEFITGSSSNKFTVTAAAAFIVLSLVLIATVCSPISYLPLKFALSGTKPPEQTCESREQRSSYLKHRSPELPPYLLSKLQEYERRHRRCGPLSESFNTTSPLGTHNDFSDGGDCKFVVYTPSQGLGNRILGLTSTFLFALLTDRVLLVDFSADMDELFCEPFPNSTWLLPGNFPFRSDFYGGWFRDVYSYGKLLEKKSPSSSSPWNSTLLQIFLDDKYSEYDKLFFKDENQGFLEKIPWLVLISDGYFIPCLFQMQTFRSELEKLFPNNKSTVFHQLGNYLLAPSNQAWSLITKFYDAHLAKAEQRIGIQIRVFDPQATPTPVVMKQILSCTETRRILPRSRQSNETSKADEVTLRNEKSKSILVASLSRKYYEEIDWMYGTRRRQSTGIAVYQASHEGKQHSGDNSHNMKAWMDIYLLSTSDVLVTSSMSTFGYVAAGIAGVKPWIVMIPDPYHPRGANESACERAINLEPCFHFPPWFAYPDPPGTGGPVGRCEDVSWGLKLVGGHKTRR
ncbi:unnamed protein product [Linum tenue]|uniref:Fucosyltransferase n=1 Tax=Linum tenue TaxID=586396 RepID=A0AAV0KK50_9ROSI|nr:unnamed protein product [Linum tenue]